MSLLVTKILHTPRPSTPCRKQVFTLMHQIQQQQRAPEGKLPRAFCGFEENFTSTIAADPFG